MSGKKKKGTGLWVIRSDELDGHLMQVQQQQEREVIPAQLLWKKRTSLQLGVRWRCDAQKWTSDYMIDTNVLNWDLNSDNSTGQCRWKTMTESAICCLMSSVLFYAIKGVPTQKFWPCIVLLQCVTGSLVVVTWHTVCCSAWQTITGSSLLTSSGLRELQKRQAARCD